MVEAGVRNGLVWMSGARLLQHCAQLVGVIALARLLDPATFGIAAIAAAVVALLTLVADFGIGVTLVRHPSPTRHHLSTAFWTALALGGLLCLVTNAVAPILGTWMSEPMIPSVTRVLSVSLLLTSVASVPRALLQRSMQFRQLARIDTTSIVAGVAVAVVLAALGAGVWSLIAQLITVQFVAAGGYLIGSGWLPSRSFSLGLLREIVHVSVGIAGYGVVNFGARNFDDLIVGRLLGSYALGLYGRAYALLMMPISLLTSAIGSVLLPALAAVFNRPRQAQRVYLDVLELGSAFALPVLLGMYVVADRFVLLVLGAEWLTLVPTLRILCVVGCFQVMLTPTGSIYQAAGATKLLFAWGVGASTLIMAAFFAGAYFGGSIEAVAWCYLAAHAILLYPGLAIPGKLIQLRAVKMLGAASAAAAAALAMAGVVALLGFASASILRPDAVLLLQVAAGVAVYVGMLQLLRPSLVGQLLAIASVRARPAGRAAPAHAAVTDALEPQLHVRAAVSE